MKRFDIRIEKPEGFYEDVLINAENLERARTRAQEILRSYRSFDWRGQVVFVDGAKPAEEHERVLERWRKRA